MRHRVKRIETPMTWQLMTWKPKNWLELQLKYRLVYRVLGDRLIGVMESLTPNPIQTWAEQKFDRMSVDQKKAYLESANSGDWTVAYDLTCGLEHLCAYTRSQYRFELLFLIEEELQKGEHGAWASTGKRRS